MVVVSSLSDPALDQQSVVSIGNFDGLHLGHRAILRAVVQRARELSVRSAVMTFDPHPIRFLAPDKAPPLISTLSQKIELIRNTGIDLLFVAPFNGPFAALSPETFIRDYLVRGLRAKSLCVGANFNFGRGQEGTVATLKAWRDQFELVEVPAVCVRGVTVSSSLIRRLISEGRMALAGLLGEWYAIEGAIVGGAGRGRKMTVPTLNLETPNELLPKNGVYVSRISLDGAAGLDSITNIGVRPTFGENTLTIETYALSDSVPDGAGVARLQFLHRVRDEQRFDSPDILREQIAKDAARARKFFRILRTACHARSHSS